MHCCRDVSTQHRSSTVARVHFSGNAFTKLLTPENPNSLTVTHQEFFNRFLIQRSVMMVLRYGYKFSFEIFFYQSAQ
jgi:hypothetical protein